VDRGLGGFHGEGIHDFHPAPGSSPLATMADTVWPASSSVR
jgi:hypothetical protein